MNSKMEPDPQMCQKIDRSLHIVTAVNSDQVLEQNLMQSPMIASGDVGVTTTRDCPSAGAAYNAGLKLVDSDVIIFAHQDVYFPAGWDAQLHNAIAVLERQADPWGILGVWGVKADGQFAGKVWCSGGNREHYGLSGVHPVVSIDEIVIAMNNRCGLRFDEQLPGFHLYATDIILQAKHRGFKAFALEAPVIHNSRFNPRPVDNAYLKAYRYMQRKWGNELPVRTCVVPITPRGWPLYKHLLRRELKLRLSSRPSRERLSSPQAKAMELGYQ